MMPLDNSWPRMSLPFSWLTKKITGQVAEFNGCYRSRVTIALAVIVTMATAYFQKYCQQAMDLKASTQRFRHDYTAYMHGPFMV